MQERVKIILKSGKDQSVRRMHPWLFSGAIKKMSGNPAEGDVVSIFDNKDEFLGVGHYQPGSIAVRIMSFTDAEINRDFYYTKISGAIEYRRSMGFLDNPSTNVFRLVHAEGDGLPGLIIDIYNDVAVMQIHSVGIYRSREDIADTLLELMPDRLKAVYDKSESTLPFKADLSPSNGFLRGKDQEAVVKENNFLFRVDWVKGQKTGFFIDQRESRKLLGEYSYQRRVLNMFGYTGGFSVYAMKDAEFVHTVDVSKQAIIMANENISINFGDNDRHKGMAEDAFKYLEKSDRQYNLIVLDPPAFAKHQNVLHNALQGYKRLNMKAMEVIQKGGILFTFSCSQVVTRENFRKSVFAAAANTGRSVRILHQLSQPVDHPVSIYHPESEYLKGLVLYID